MTHGNLSGSMQHGTWEEIDLYRLFSCLLGFPAPDRFSLIAQAGFHEAMDGLWTRLGCEGKAPPAIGFASLEQYEACYIALFDVGSPEPPVPLLESWYHEAIPAQQTVLENVSFYEVIDLRPVASVSAPDHLLTQLEFGAAVRYLQEGCGSESERQNLRRLERDFLERHLLSWIPAALARLEQLGPPIFPVLFMLLLRFLRTRFDEIQ